jgi:hypothetical protein
MENKFSTLRLPDFRLTASKESESPQNGIRRGFLKTNEEKAFDTNQKTVAQTLQKIYHFSEPSTVPISSTIPCRK